MLSGLSHGQNRNVDSLKQALKKASHDTTLCQILNDIGEEFYNADLLDSAIANWQKTILLARQGRKNSNPVVKHRFTRQLIEVLNNMGYTYQGRGKSKEALKYYEESLALAEETGDIEGMSLNLMTIGISYDRIGDIQKALSYYNRALKMLEKRNSQGDISVIYVKLAYIYSQQGDKASAITYLQKALKISEKLDNKTHLALVLNNLSTIYRDSGDPLCSSSKDECITLSRQKALAGFLRAKELYAAEKSYKGVCGVYNNIANLYKQQGDMDSALVYANRSLELSTRIDEKRSIAFITALLTEIMLERNNIKAANAYAVQCMNVAKKLGYPESMMSAARAMKIVFLEQKNYKGAYEMQELFIQMRDSINNVANRKAGIKQQLQFEYEKQAQNDSIVNLTKMNDQRFKHEKEISLQRIYTYIGIIGFVFMLLLALIAFRAYRIKQRSNIVITQQKQDLERMHLLNQKIFSVISHDFRGPILSLNLLLDKFRRQSEDEKLNNYIKDISSQVTNANEILNNLLNWARTEINIKDLDKRTASVLTIFNDVAKEFETKLGEKKLTLVKQFSDDSDIALPPDIFRIALRNLVSNAIKFSYPANDIEINFNETSHILTVKDFGIGMSETTLAQLFHKQVNSGTGTQKEEGFGMGLYIISELLHKYNYTISAQSKPDEGTSFAIEPNSA